jgi:acetoin utilization protein AcuB
MTPEVHTASPDTTLAEALSLTRTHRIRHLPILSDGRLVGLVTLTKAWHNVGCC